MATSMPLPLNPHVPVTPPPDHQTFIKPEGPPSPQNLKSFVQGVYGSMEAKLQAQATLSSAAAAAAPATKDAQKATDPTAAALDPKYVAMVSRIASYYQQRCQAVANFQQQRCQAWANMHRQKCQEMMQAAMLVVAWYIRDRINRRRRRQKRHFRKGLSERVSRNRVTKGESVRRWVLNVPEGALSPNNPVREMFADDGEASFDIDKEVLPDKDTKLFNVADNLIKRQLCKIDVPLMGALSFDESDSESEEEEEPEDIELEEEDIDDDDDDEEEDDDADDYEDEDMEDGDDIGSELVQHGTGGGSRKRTRTSSSG